MSEEFDPVHVMNEDSFAIHAAEQTTIDTGLVLQALRLCENLHERSQADSCKPTERISLLLSEVMTHADKLPDE